MTTTREPRRATRPAGPPRTSTCCCRQRVLGHLEPGGQPTPVATFQNGDLVTVELRHWGGRDGCWLPTEHINPRDYTSRP